MSESENFSACNLHWRRAAESLDWYVAMCGDDLSPIAKETAKAVCTEGLKAMRHGIDIKLYPQPLSALYNRWIQTKSVSVYDAPEYLLEAWLYWAVYGRRYIKALSKTVIRGSEDFGSPVSKILCPHRVVDVGNGVGLSTRDLRAIFPTATVVGTNFEGRQARVARRLGIDVFTTLDSVGACDTVYASEYFEHFERPIDHLRDVLSAVSPTSLIVANTFNSPAIGHFDSYVIGSKTVGGAVASRQFNNELRSQGFTQMKTGFWNNRPAVWTK